METLLSNMYVYKSSVPNHIQFLYDLDSNPYYLEELSENIYDTIRRVPYTLNNRINHGINPHNSVQSNDMFITFKINESIDIITQSNYKEGENFPFHFLMLDEGLLCDFIDPTTFENKLIQSSRRYLAFDVDFVSEIKNGGHSILVVFDTKLKTCFLLDSNGTLDYFNSNILKINFTNLIHSTMEFYCSLLAYDYIKIKDIGINFNPNHKMISQFQKSFFKGYCKGWTLFLQYIILTSSNDFEFIDFIRDFQQTDKLILNQLIEIFQVWFYRTFNLDKLKKSTKQVETTNNCDH